MSEHQVSNKEILEVLQQIQDKSESIVVLTPDEVKTFREILKTITIEDLKYIKEYSEDKIAVNRVFGKTKNFILVTAAIVVAYFAIIKNIAGPLRETILRFLQGGTPGV